MAIDPNVTRTNPESKPASAIENEIPAYRAISPLAITSLILGALSILSFAHWFFLSFAVAAVVLGFLADRKIGRFSDVLTGRGFAQAGIGLGLIFGLAAVTTSAVQGYLRTSAATRFATAYAQVLQDKSLEDALWYQAPPEAAEGEDERPGRQGDEGGHARSRRLRDADRVAPAAQDPAGEGQGHETSLLEDRIARGRRADHLRGRAPGTDRARCEACPRRRVRHGAS